jgi:hypothetical protein
MATVIIEEFLLLQNGGKTVVVTADDGITRINLASPFMDRGVPKIELPPWNEPVVVPGKPIFVEFMVMNEHVYRLRIIRGD